MPKFLKIGELAKKAGVPTSSVNYWTHEGFLMPSKTTEGGHRLYPEKESLLVIRGLKNIKKQKNKKLSFLFKEACSIMRLMGMTGKESKSYKYLKRELERRKKELKKIKLRG